MATSSRKSTLTKEALVKEILGIPAAVDAAKERKRENWPVRANRSSELGHPCLRYLTYLRVAWQQRALPSIELQYLFDERARQEEHAVEDLKAAGYTFIQQQRPFAWEKYDISGKIDGQIILPRGATYGEAVPAEIKNVNPWDWAKIAPEGGIVQFLQHDHVWMRKVPTQMMAYLLMDNKEVGALIMRNASDGRPKVVPVVLDLDVGEEMLKKAEAVNRHVKAETLPDRIPYSQEVCGRCPFFHICLPDEALRAAVEMLDNEDLEAKLKRHAELESNRKEYERIDKEIKAVAKDVLGPDGQATVGTDWLLRTATSPRKGYTVPATSVTRVDIERLGPAKDTPSEEVH